MNSGTYRSLTKNVRQVAKMPLIEGMKSTPKWNPFEHQVYRLWKSQFPSYSNWLVASSGGLDSMGLLHLVLQLKSALHLKLRVAHVHHGISGNKKTDAYRAKAQQFVAKWCKKNDIEFVTWPPEKQSGSSEEAFRKLRRRLLNSALHSDEWLVTAHHETDLFETRVLRLLRGVGPQGLKSMQPLDKQSRTLRPFLSLSRGEIENYVNERKIRFVQDPSNASGDYLRNWLRRDWLKRLEKKSPGSVKAWARSLESLTEAIGETKTAHAKTKISRKSLAALPLSKKKTKLARFLKQNGFSGYGQTHIAELLKRLDSARKRHTFELLGRTWNLDPQHLALKRDS